LSDIATGFVDMANNREAIYGTITGGCFENEEEKIFLMLIILKMFLF
jgi:hypothetical protein